MSATIREVAADLNVNPADVVAIVVGQLSDIDLDDTIDPMGKSDGVIETTDGVYENTSLTTTAIAALFDQFDGDRELLADKYGIR